MNCDHTKYICMMKTFWEYLHNEQISEPQVSERPTSEVPATETPVAATRNIATPAVGQPVAQPAALPQPATQSFKPRIKPWKAKKSEILSFWKALAPDIPLQLQPIDSAHKGSTLQQDTIRVTGTKEFITTILSRLKDFVVYENPDTKLVLDYRQNQKSLKPGEKNSYLFYLNVRKRK